ncbi:glycoside hydrolase family 65 protein [Fulvivirga ligni]|uniref:glycoside hydrolase family 65 protein n=1 Tax=Fulvivirga ligni TaxID=2904246 RepID=UPI001F3454BE|nr:glycoside hydrolase family 65 protein [Fulvivirga ligni]UII19526.1 glycoside hydrolase family 65 protein [Fulvivirga ligni]
MRIVVFFIIQLAALTAYAQNNLWTIQAQQIDPNNYFGVTVANGMVGIVSSPEPLKVSDVVLNGVYDYYQRGRVSNILKTFNHVNMNLDVDGQRVNKNNISGYAQSLNMKKAFLQTQFKVGSKLSVQQEIRSLRHLPYTALITVKLTAHENVEVIPMSVIEAPNHLMEVHNLYSEIDRPHVKIPLLASVGLSPSGKHKIAASTSFIFKEEHGSEPDLIHEDWDYNMHLAKFKKKLKKGEVYEFGIVASAVSDEHYKDPHNEAERLTIFAALEGKDRLIKYHEQAWEELWKSDIVIEGDDQAQKDVRFAIYHLYSFARKGTAYSLSPMGLSGLGYNGHVFWDTELWMYPPLLILQPEIAKSLLEYRYERLDAAKQNAFAHGYKGAMYPWESSDEGSEDTPVWALTGPFQHHISGDVAWAFWKYYQVTHDKLWLQERGWPVLKEVADFWSSRVERNGPGQYDIKNVIGANEWQENIDNNAFTNAMAKLSLNYATQAAKELNIAADPDWMHVAENIPILKFPDGTTRENATYDGVNIKQADVNLLAFPLDIITDQEQIKKDLNYYSSKMDKTGPAMGKSVLSALYAQTGDMKRAYDMFLQSYKQNEVPPFGIISETAGGTNPYFATGAGGMLQAVIMGFGGLKITDEGIIQGDVLLPKQWKSLKITGWK